MNSKPTISRSRSFGVTLGALSICAAGSLVVSVDAQSVGVVVPRYAAALEGNRVIKSVFRESYGRRVQVIIGESHVRALAGKRIYEIAFRKDLQERRFFRFLRGDVKAPMRILASFSSADPARPSIVFSHNHSTPIEVFRGDVTAPLVSQDDKRSFATFSATEAPTIRFTTPILHEGGKSLVLTFITEGGREGYPWMWPVDAEIAHLPGTVQSIGKSCWQAQELLPAEVIEGSLRPGMHIKAESTTPPNPVAAFLIIGMSDKFAFGSVPLPLRIAEPGCDLLVSPDLLLPGLFHRGGSSRDDGKSGAIIATPYQTSLYGSTIFLQHLFLHQDGSELRLRTSNALRATFTKVPPVLDASLVASLDKDATHGRVFLDYTPVLRILAK